MHIFQLKCGSEKTVVWMFMLCNLAQKQGVVPEDQMKAITDLLYKGKGNGDKCNSYRGISLLSVLG